MAAALTIALSAPMAFNAPLAPMQQVRGHGVCILRPHAAAARDWIGTPGSALHSQQVAVTRWLCSPWGRLHAA